MKERLLSGSLVSYFEERREGSRERVSKAKMWYTYVCHVSKRGKGDRIYHVMSFYSRDLYLSVERLSSEVSLAL